MSTMPDPTVQTPVEPTAPIPVPQEPPVVVRAAGSTSAAAEAHSTPLGDLRPEDPKRNPITYLALGIALLALLLSLFALTRDTGPNQIDVDGRRCIIDRIDGNEADTLFCQS